jgi:hypothetical protein
MMGRRDPSVHVLGVTGNLVAEEVDRKIVPPRSFDKRKDPEDLAADQEVEPADAFDALLGDFRPENEGAEEFVAALREWRRSWRFESPNRCLRSHPPQ